MNATLRRRHRVLTTVLALAVPVGLAAALAARPSAPIMATLPVADEALQAFRVTVGQAGSLAVEGALLNAMLLATSAQPARYAVRIQPTAQRGVRGPDVLVYWSAGSDSGKSESVPDGAHLLGTLAGGQTRTLPLPVSARPGAGRLLFFSLAHQRLFEQSWPLPAAAAGVAQ